MDFADGLGELFQREKLSELEQSLEKQSGVECVFYGTNLRCNLYAKDTTYLDKELSYEQEKEKEWEK